MAENILNENLEEIVETPVVDDELIDEEMMVVPEEMPPQRVNPFCVVEKKGVIVTDINKAEHVLRDIQTNGAWGANPYGDAYAVVPDDMVTDIMETHGFCDIELNEDGTEVVSFTAREIPEIPVAEAPPTDVEILYEIEADQEFRLCCLELGLTADDFA